MYDATNYATFNDYSPIVAIIDSIWGGILFTLVFLVHKKLV
ncbi:DUF2177 family protein [Streptococcus pneumoniae]